MTLRCAVCAISLEQAGISLQQIRVSPVSCSQRAGFPVGPCEIRKTRRRRAPRAFSFSIYVIPYHPPPPEKRGPVFRLFSKKCHARRAVRILYIARGPQIHHGSTGFSDLYARFMNSAGPAAGLSGCAKHFRPKFDPTPRPRATLKRDYTTATSKIFDPVGFFFYIIYIYSIYVHLYIIFSNSRLTRKKNRRKTSTNSEIRISRRDALRETSAEVSNPAPCTVYIRIHYTSSTYIIHNIIIISYRVFSHLHRKVIHRVICIYYFCNIIIITTT